MSLKRSLSTIAMIALVSCGLSPRAAQAGPLLDWLFGRTQTPPAHAVGAPVPVSNAYAAGYGAVGYPASGYSAAGYAANYGTYYGAQLPAIGPAGAGYTAPMPTGIAAATLPATMPSTLSYVPNFQTQAQRTPVTYYRPLLTTDPNTGTQVVAMAPCTSYETMAQRTPALGRSALFGSNTPPTFQPPAQALPTYTIPSGGIPLAYSSPAITAPYSTAYGVYGTNDSIGGYSALQPQAGLPALGAYPGGQIPAGMAPTSVGPAGAYPTAPLSQSPYYGSTSGGSSGGSNGMSTPWQTVAPGSVPSSIPGLVAPQASATAPAYTQPPYSSQPDYGPAPTISPAPSSGPPAGVYPGPADPADAPPVLPPVGTSAAAPTQRNDLRPTLRSVVRHPQTSEPPQQANASRSKSDSSSSEGRSQVPTMLPIPAPADFNHEPRWNPGLLREEDMTASRPITPSGAQWAGHAKPIVWASFESPNHESPSHSAIAAEATVTSSHLRPILAPSASPSSSIWPDAPSSVSQALSISPDAPSSDLQLSPPTIQNLPESRLVPTSNPAAHVRRDASGWKAPR